jgi:hypothetical protein
MTFRDKQRLEKELDEKKIKIYEDNLKLHYESYRKHLDIQLSTSMPHQIGNIKTILWVNLLFIGLSVQALKDEHFSQVHLLFYVPVTLSIILMLIALLQRRTKWYGTYDNIDYAYEIDNSKYATSKMIGTLLANVRTAVEENRKIMRYISRYMHAAMWTTLLASVGLIIVLALSYPMKGGDAIMAEEKPKPSEQPINVRPTHESSERSVKEVVEKVPKDIAKK